MGRNLWITDIFVAEWYAIGSVPLNGQNAYESGKSKRMHINRETDEKRSKKGDPGSGNAVAVGKTCIAHIQRFAHVRQSCMRKVLTGSDLMSR